MPIWILIKLQKTEIKKISQKWLTQRFFSSRICTMVPVLHRYYTISLFYLGSSKNLNLLLFCILVGSKETNIHSIQSGNWIIWTGWHNYNIHFCWSIPKLHFCQRLTGSFVLKMRVHSGNRKKLKTLKNVILFLWNYNFS